jgi:hypothetical protein
MKAALHALHYINSIHDYGLSFTLNDIEPMHLLIHFPPSTDMEAYQDALPPQEVNSSTLLSYSNAWQSITGGVVFRNGGPLG